MNDIDLSIGIPRNLVENVINYEPLSYRSVDPFLLERRVDELEMEVSELRMMLENITIEARNAGLLGGPPSLSEILNSDTDVS